MDPARAKELQDDEQREESPETAIRTMIEGELIDVHTSMPGIVKSFDAKTQTATVQPAIRRFFIGRGYVNLPQCVDVPVSFPRYGNFIITGPVSPGDEGELSFSERCIDNWWTTGGVQDPAEPRMHDLSDASFTPGISSKGRVPANIASDALEIRTLDGSTLLRVDAAAATVGTTAGAERAYKADSHHAALDPYLDVIVTELGAALSALGLVPAGTALTAAQTAWKTAVQAGFATKAKVG